MENIRISEPQWWHFLIMMPIFLLVRLWQYSVRIKIDDRSARILSDKPRMVGVAWHSNIFYLPICKYKFRHHLPMSGLVSASKDGCYLCAFFKLLNIGAVRGSSNRRGAGAIWNLVERLKSSDVFITPDGPRGPKNVAKLGFLMVAQQSGARIVGVRFKSSHFIALNSWDSFVLPIPFSSVVVEVTDFGNYDALLKTAECEGIEPQAVVERFLSADF